jgi:hypothetical protein
MSIYHRTYTRAPLAMNVQLRFKGKKIGLAFTRNVNPFGAFIELSEPKLKVNDFVGVSFINKDKDNTSVTQKGMVVHSNSEGVGLLFAKDTNEFRSMLNQELKQKGNNKVSFSLDA